MSRFYWVTFAADAPGTVEAESEAEATATAKRFGTPTKLRVLPYPADPRLAVQSDCPSFCYRPHVCQGRTACPNSPSCTS